MLWRATSTKTAGAGGTSNDALTRHPDIDATDIEVRVQNGEVSLAGAVDDKYAKRLAEDIAEACSGVTDVRNELRVRLPRPRPSAAR
ncbi:MAG: BON domain-containing protein [Gemmatimonadota bacterium]|nr:BON domain-containing protein [Gemmatimonadota bacterium]